MLPKGAKIAVVAPNSTSAPVLSDLSSSAEKKLELPDQFIDACQTGDLKRLKTLKRGHGQMYKKMLSVSTSGRNQNLLIAACNVSPYSANHLEIVNILIKDKVNIND